MLVHSLPMRSRKRLARDVFDILLHMPYYVTDKDCWVQNGGTHGLVSVSLLRQREMR